MRKLLRWLAVVALAIVVFGVIAASLMSGLGSLKHRSAADRFVAEVGPLEPEKYAPEKVPDVENATRWIQKGVEAVEFEHDKVGQQGDRYWLERCGSEGPAVVPPDKLALVREALTRNEGAFTDLEKAIALPRASWNIDYENGVDAKVPNLLSAMRTAKSLACDARLAIADGDAPRAVRRIEVLGRMARSYETEPAIIVLLIGSAIERIQLLAVREAVASTSVPTDALLALDASLVDVSLHERWRTSIAAEAAALHRTLERAGEPGGDHSQASGFERFVQKSVWSVAGRWWMSEQLRQTTDVHKALEAVPVREASAQALLNRRRAWWARFFPDTMPNLTVGMERSATTETLRHLAHRAIGLRLLAAVTERYPAALDPPSTAEDDPFSGEPFTWKVAGDGSATLSAAKTAQDVEKVVMGSEGAWWTFTLPAPTPPVAPSSSSPTTPAPPDTAPPPRPPEQTPPS